MDGGCLYTTTPLSNAELSVTVRDLPEALGGTKGTLIVELKVTLNVYLNGVSPLEPLR